MVALIGVGGHGRDILAIMDRLDIVPVLYDDGDNAFPSSENCTQPAYLGVNNSQQRADLAKRLDLLIPPPLIDIDARIGRRGCWLDPGVVLAGGVRLVRDVTIGKHTHVNWGVGMTRCTIGDFTTVCPGADIGGDVQIGSRVLIGMGAKVCNLVTIGDDAVIAAGAVVLPGSHVPAGKHVHGEWGPQCSSSR